MRHSSHVVATLLVAVIAATAVLRGQSRQEVQLLAELRVVQEQIQQLKLAVAALTEHGKATNGRLDAQGDVLRTNHANDTATLESLGRRVDAIGQRLGQFSTQVTQFAQELPALRQSQAQQKVLLDQIVALLTVAPPTDPADVLTGTAPAATGGGVTPSAHSAYISAFGYFAAGTDYDVAIDAFKAFLAKYPDASDSPRAQFYLGMSLFHQGKYQEAIAAFDVVIKTYSRATETVADSYYQQGKSLEALGKKPEAIKAYQQVRTQFPDSGAALLVKNELSRLGVK